MQLLLLSCCLLLDRLDRLPAMPLLLLLLLLPDRLALISRASLVLVQRLVRWRRRQPLLLFVLLLLLLWLLLGLDCNGLAIITKHHLLCSTAHNQDRLLRFASSP